MDNLLGWLNKKKKNIKWLFIEIGLFQFIKGKFRKIKLKKMCKKFGFSEWHTIPIEHKPYVKRIVNYINDFENFESIYEVGCGLGDILSKLKAKHRIGIDTSEGVIQAAKRINKNIEFKLGTFKDIKNQNIDCLIAVNFIHNINSQELTQIFSELCKKNNIDNLIVDRPEIEGYKYYHNFDLVLPSNYILKKIILKKDLNNRTIFHYEKISEK